MLRLSLAFHDVVGEGDLDSSGFFGPSAAHYKLTPACFEAHLDAISRAGLEPSLVTERADDVKLTLTFDDGGRSATELIAPALARRGWPAHFFVTTGQLGSSGFLSPQDLRRLADQGHLVGSHGHTHRPLTRLSASALRDELRRSRQILEEELGELVVTLAAPGGFCSARVVEAAADEGYLHLFTSEPSLRPRNHRTLTVHGRFALVAGSTPGETARLCALSASEIWRRRAAWAARASARRALGPAYERARETVLTRRAAVR
jgi:peptidoglycan/xylan/chitin deacetylase (PgdA/CDA1 family)